MSARNRPPDHLPEHIRDNPAVVEACRARDVGRLFIRIQNLSDDGAKFTNSHLARRCELHPDQVSRYMSGQHRVQHLEIIERIADGLRIPGARFRLGARPWETGAVQTTESGSRPQPRPAPSTETAPLAMPAPGLVATTAAADLGMAPSAFLAKIVPQTPIPRQIGWNDVEHVRSTTRAVAMSENLFGGGLSCEAATEQLRWAGRLLEVPASDDVRRALMEAVGNLGSVVAFAAFDIGEYISADQCFRFALWCADEGGSWALRANTLAEMSRKAVYLGQTDDALTLIEFAQVRAERVSATARAMMSALRARLLALMGRHDEASDEVTRADEQFEQRDQAADPPWLCYYDEAEHQGSTARALTPVAQATGCIELVVPRLQNAIRLHDANYPRSRTFSRTRLASLMMTSGDPHEAVIIGHQALTEAAPLRSDRIVDELHTLARVAKKHARISDVNDLRHEIAALPAGS